MSMSGMLLVEHEQLISGCISEESNDNALPQTINYL